MNTSKFAQVFIIQHSLNLYVAMQISYADSDVFMRLKHSKISKVHSLATMDELEG
jgi:hypothetical protein